MAQADRQKNIYDIWWKHVKQRERQVGEARKERKRKREKERILSRKTPSLTKLTNLLRNMRNKNEQKHVKLLYDMI